MIQHRYGWTDETIRNLPFSRFMQLVKISSEARRAEAKEKFVLAAFVGFQMGAGGKGTFGSYLSRLKLSDEPAQHIGPQSKEAEAERLSRMGIKVRTVKKE